MHADVERPTSTNYSHTPPPFRTLVVDDHGIVREAVTAVLEGDRRVKVAGSASNGEEAIHSALCLKPDLVIAYDGGNDLIQPWAYDPRPGYPFNFLTEEEAMSTLANSQGDAKTIASLARDSAVIQASESVANRGTPARAAEPARPQPGAAGSR